LIHFYKSCFRATAARMNNINSQGEVQRLLSEKEQLKREEQQLRKIIEQVKDQVNALEVEQLEVNNRKPLATVSPTEIEQEQQQQQTQELNLNRVLGQLVSGTYAVDQGEEEEDD